MACTIVLRNAETGEEREIAEKRDWDSPGLAFCWTEGNFSCDCNRHLAFNGWPDEDDDETNKCGDDRYLLPRVILGDGREVQIETA